MRLTLDALQTIDTIARRGSFAAAAEELHKVPSALSYTLHKLERDLGVTIFDRSGHRARLTLAGETLLAEGRQLLRAAGELENTVQRVARGWETQLTIAVEPIIPVEPLYRLLERFYEHDCGTRIRITHEVLSGAWDALVSGRADLVIGTSGDGPAGGGYGTRPIGFLPFAFVVAPDHPLAGAPDPLTEARLLEHRVVAVADTTRNLPPRSTAILTGQDVLTVPDMELKRAAQLSGLGIGVLPRYLVSEDITAGRLVEKQVEGAPGGDQLGLAWRLKPMGKALAWFLEQLEDPACLRSLLRDAA